MDNKKGPLFGQPSSSRILTLGALDKLYDDIIVLQKQIEDKKIAEGRAEKKRPSTKKSMRYDATVKTLNLKFYPEQLLRYYATDDELDTYRQKVEDSYNRMLQDDEAKPATFLEGKDLDFLFARLAEEVGSFEKAFIIMFIIHNRCVVVDPTDFFLSAAIKSHCHMVVKRRDNRAFRLNSFLDALHLDFRRKVDNELWRHGVATCKNFGSCVAYLTHETPKAQAEGKLIYSRDEIVSNCTVSEIDDFREGYLLTCEHRKLTAQELVKLDRQFYDQGYNMKDFDQLFNAQEFLVRSNSKIRTVTESYNRGILDRLRKDPPKVNRLCLFVQGEPNTGKTYALRETLKQLGLQTYEITGGGSGKFDRLRITDQAILVDDEVCPNLLNMTDSRVTTAYRRQANNPYWAGSVFVVTSNLKFLDWCKESGLTIWEDDVSPTNPWGERKKVNSHGKAMLSRFICCRVVEDAQTHTNQIVMQPWLSNLRGTQEEQDEKASLAKKIIESANEIMKTYQPKKIIHSPVDSPITILGHQKTVDEWNKAYLDFCKKVNEHNFTLDEEVPKKELMGKTFFDWISDIARKDDLVMQFSDIA